MNHSPRHNQRDRLLRTLLATTIILGCLTVSSCADHKQNASSALGTSEFDNVGESRNTPALSGERLGNQNNYILSVPKVDLSGNYHLRVGNIAPEIEAHDLNGIPFTLSDYRGSVVMLAFWGDW